MIERPRDTQGFVSKNKNGYDVFQNASKGWALIKTVKSRSCAAISNLSQFSVAQKL